jgi:hypothetical protein
VTASQFRACVRSIRAGSLVVIFMGGYVLITAVLSSSFDPLRVYLPTFDRAATRSGNAARSSRPSTDEQASHFGDAHAPTADR